MKRIIAACLATSLILPSVAIAAPTKLAATLTGEAETDGGAPGGTGTFSADVDADLGDFCFSLAGSNIDTPTVAHIHPGKAGENGPAIIDLTIGDDECIAVEPDVLKPILAAPGNYYVNIHTQKFPKGAVRGQLAKAK